METVTIEFIVKFIAALVILKLMGVLCRRLDKYIDTMRDADEDYID